MKEERSPREIIRNRFVSYFSHLQKQHNEQMAVVLTLSGEVDKVQDQLDKLRARLDIARNTLSKSQSCEQSEFVEFKRVIEALLDAVEKNEEVWPGSALGSMRWSDP